MKKFTISDLALGILLGIVSIVIEIFALKYENPVLGILCGMLISSAFGYMNSALLGDAIKEKITEEIENSDNEE